MQITDSSDLLRMIRAISGAASLAEVEAKADQPLSLRLEPGQDVRGEVIANLTNGRSLVRIAGDLLDMNLPASIKPGETVLLTFVRDTPRLTFSLGREGDRGSQVTVSDAGRWLTLLNGTPPGEDLPSQDIARLITSASKDAVLVTAEETTATSYRLGLQPGQQTSGNVVAELPNGQVQVRIANQLLEMNIQRPVTAGMALDLMFVTDKPVPLFVLLQPSAPGSTAVTEAGRWLSFVSRVHQAEAPPAPASPLLPGPDDMPSTSLNQGLADRLRDALTRSGLFYESHLAEWAAGKTPTVMILKEPQGRLSRLDGAETGGKPVPSSSAETEIAGLTAKQSPVKDALYDLRSLDLADQRTLPIVKQQLALLQTGQFVWQGEAWPGQKMEWGVREREPDPEENTADRQWSTTLTLDTPRLGKVRAELHLQGKRLHVTVQSEEPGTVNLMRGNVQKLRDGVAAAGLTLADLVISNDQ